MSSKASRRIATLLIGLIALFSPLLVITPTARAGSVPTDPGVVVAPAPAKDKVYRGSISCSGGTSSWCSGGAVFVQRQQLRRQLERVLLHVQQVLEGAEPLHRGLERRKRMACLASFITSAIAFYTSGPGIVVVAERCRYAVGLLVCRVTSGRTMRRRWREHEPRISGYRWALAWHGSSSACGGPSSRPCGVGITFLVLGVVQVVSTLQHAEDETQHPDCAASPKPGWGRPPGDCRPLKALETLRCTNERTHGERSPRPAGRCRGRGARRSRACLPDSAGAARSGCGRLAYLDWLIELAEDYADVRGPRGADEMAETGEQPVPWEQVKADLGLA